MGASELRMLADAIKARVAVPQAASWFGFMYTAGDRNPCPICVDTSTSKKTLQLFEDGARWWCHSCNEGGDVIDWIGARLNLKKGQAISHLAARLGVSGDPDALLAFLHTELSARARDALSSDGLAAALGRGVRRAFLRWKGARSEVPNPGLWKEYEHSWSSCCRLAAQGDRRAMDLAARLATRNDALGPFADRHEHKLNRWAAAFYASCIVQPGPYRDWAGKRHLTHAGFPDAGACFLRGGLGPQVRKQQMDLAPFVAAGLLNRGGYETMAGRVVFPIRDVLGRCIAFGGRLIEAREGREQGKYINTRDTAVFRKAHTLYALSQAFHSICSTGTAVIVEGYTDVASCHAAGLTNTVASCGTGFTRHHAACLARWAGRVVIMLDGDAAGQRAAARAQAELQAEGLQVAHVCPPGGMDPDDWVRAYGPADALGAVNEALGALGQPSSLDWLYRKLGAR